MGIGSKKGPVGDVKELSAEALAALEKKFGADIAVGAKEISGGLGPMYRSADSDQLEKILTSYYGVEKNGARVGNGGLGDALRYENQTGDLLSTVGHTQKAVEMQTRLNNFIRKADNQPPRSYPYTQRDIDYARELLKDLSDAIKR